MHSHRSVFAAGYVQQLNTNGSLYRLLVRALDRHSIDASNKVSPGYGSVNGYTPEALRVGCALKHDFEKSGIHLPEEQRSRLTGLIDLERRIGMQIGAPFLLISQALAFKLGAKCSSLSFG